MIALAVLALIATAAPAPLPFVTVAEGARSGVRTPRQVVVRTAAEWRALWEHHAGTTAAAARARPEVDFSRFMIVAVFGGRSAAGERVRIRRVVREAGQVVVLIGVVRGPRLAEATTSFHIVRLPRTDVPVVFAVEGARREPLVPPIEPHGP